MSICLPCRAQPHLPEVCADRLGCFCQHKMDDRIWGFAPGIGFYNLAENLARGKHVPRRTAEMPCIDVPLPEPESSVDRPVRDQQSR